jgi:hypothetical protein
MVPGVLAMIGRWTLVLVAFWLGQAGGPQPTVTRVVTVRFIDARNGKPYAYNKDVVTIFLYKLDPSKGFKS